MVQRLDLLQNLDWSEVFELAEFQIADRHFLLHQRLELFVIEPFRFDLGCCRQRVNLSRDLLVFLIAQRLFDLVDEVLLSDGAAIAFPIILRFEFVERLLGNLFVERLHESLSQRKARVACQVGFHLHALEHRRDRGEHFVEVVPINLDILPLVQRLPHIRRL